jgi:hypothetical protein
MTQRTQTFIGSSSEGLGVASAIAAMLADATECRVWTEGVFLPGRTFIETLERLLEEVDYAILVASADDKVTIRDVESLTMRDNVLLELGLFMAKLGRGRTYLVTPCDNPIRVPSDLLGVQTVTYASPEEEDEAGWAQVLQGPCHAIQVAMAEAEKELSLAMKRTLVRQILAWTTDVQEFLVKFQSRSIRSILDRRQFERVRQDMIEQLAKVVELHTEDAARLGVAQEYDQLARSLTHAAETFPFPEEASVTSQQAVSGLLNHVFGRASIEDQVKTRADFLLTRYANWWDDNSAEIARQLVALQSALIGMV